MHSRGPRRLDATTLHRIMHNELMSSFSSPVSHASDSKCCTSSSYRFKQRNGYWVLDMTAIDQDWQSRIEFDYV